jgi:hypothetical protein
VSTGLDKQVWASVVLGLVDGLLYTSVMSHFLYGLRLVAYDLGARLERHQRTGFWPMTVAALVPGLWQVIRLVR